MNDIKSRLDELTLILTTFRSVIDSHMVNFFTHDLWNKNVPVEIRNEVKDAPLESILEAFWSSDTNCLEISKFVRHLKSFYLETFENCLVLNQFKALMENWGCRDCNIKLDQSFMSFKKSHEVEVLSNIITSLSNALKCSHIVDVGGGKGYLSAVLCLQHKFKVIGLDSSSTNTSSATKRTARMQKAWNSIRRKIENGKECKRRGKHWKAKTLTENHRTSNDESGVFSGIEGEHDSSNEPTTSNTYAAGSNNNSLVDRFKQLTHFVSCDTSLLDVVRDCFPSDERIRLALVGLHTCGDLGANCLRLFLDNITSGHVALLVNIGCCYNLLSEEFQAQQESGKQTISNQSRADFDNTQSEYGFPLSRYLCLKEFSLSYNARVLSAQPVDRISEFNKMPDKVLFYRALLQVIISRGTLSSCTNSATNTEVFSVGHIECTDFVDYIKKALAKLGLDFTQVDKNEVLQIYKEYEERVNELYTYFMMRVVLAPLIEAVILLDRLMYLVENGVSDAYLVRVFDPLLSPRCYGIIAHTNKFASDRDTN